MPLFLLPFIGWARSALGAVFQFLSTPLGMRIAAAVAACLGLWWFGQHEFNSGKRACETRHAEAAAQERTREVKVFADADTRAVARSAISETRNTQNRTIVRVIHDQTAAMPDHDATCIPADIADRLREIH